MQLADLFVSYKQVENPESESLKFLTFDYPEFNPLLEVLLKVELPKTLKQVKYFFNPVGIELPLSSKISSKWISPYIRNKNKWVLDMTNAYKKAGLNDNAIKNLISKNALESNWGKSALGNYNFGNITTGSKWKGDYVKGKDKNASGLTISLKFRAYKSIDDYVNDEILFLTKLYDFDQNDTFDQFINKLLGLNSGKRFYAEARDYKDKVRKVYDSI